MVYGHSPVDEHLDYFKLRTVVMNSLVHVFQCIYVLILWGIYIPGTVLADTA